MDHYASALGGVQFLDFAHGNHCRLRQRLEGFVFVDSRQKKDTLGMLRLIKSGELAALEAIRGRFPGNDLAALSDADLEFLPGELRPWGLAAVGNYRLTCLGRELLAEEAFDAGRLGELLNRQQRILCEHMRNTTPLIDRIHRTALEAGALGGKMNGSVGGGTLFFYAPGREPQVAGAVRSLDVRADLIDVG
jgi:galactokinase